MLGLAQRGPPPVVCLGVQPAASLHSNAQEYCNIFDLN